MKNILRLFVLGTFSFMLFGIMLNTQTVERENDTSDLRFVMLDLSNEVMIANSEISEVKENYGKIVITAFIIFFIARIITVWGKSNLLVAFTSISISMWIEMTIVVLIACFSWHEHETVSIALVVIFSLVTILWKILEVTTWMDDRHEGLFNVYDSLEDYIDNVNSFNNKIKNLTKNYKNAIS